MIPDSIALSGSVTLSCALTSMSMLLLLFLAIFGTLSERVHVFFGRILAREDTSYGDTRIYNVVETLPAIPAMHRPQV
jgi:hypothetical protein